MLERTLDRRKDLISKVQLKNLQSKGVDQKVLNQLTLLEINNKLENYPDW